MVIIVSDVVNKRLRTSPAHIINLALCDEMELARAAAYFVEMLDAALIAPTPQKVEDKIDELERKFNELERYIRAMGLIIPLLVEPVLPPTEEKWLIIGDKWDAMKKKPSRLRLPNGQILDVRSWKEVLMEACKYCLTTEPRLLQQLPIADRTGRATKLISTIKPPSNLNSGSFIVNEMEIHVCVNYSANDCVANAEHMFGKLGNSSAPAAVLLAE